MYIENGKFFADWREKDGRRKRKSFDSKKAALNFENAMKRTVKASKKVQGRQPSRECSNPIRSAKVITLTKRPQKE